MIYDTNGSLYGQSPPDTNANGNGNSEPKTENKSKYTCTLVGSTNCGNQIQIRGATETFALIAYKRKLWLEVSVDYVINYND